MVPPPIQAHGFDVKMYSLEKEFSCLEEMGRHNLIGFSLTMIKGVFYTR